jgi:hypothetical protein
MPGMLGRLIQLLRLVNYGPNLADYLRHNVMSQAPFATDILHHLTSPPREISEWEHLEQLDNAVRSFKSDTALLQQDKTKSQPMYANIMKDVKQYTAKLNKSKK